MIYHESMNGKQVIAKLKEAGWTLARIEGSHHIMEKTGATRCIPVPVHGAKDIGSGLLAAIQRQSGVKLK
jgi:predicted RNA binding protein YcfA (HicA-like mRNA interferase family)